MTTNLTESTLKQARAQAGLSLREAARRAGTSHATLSAYEAGRKSPSINTLQRILQACGYSLNLTLAPRIRQMRGLDRGDELLEVLALAEQFPNGYANKRPPLAFPPLGPVVAAVTLAEKIIAVHRALAENQVPHAFGGALALAWCTQAARGTIDIDVNLFVDVDAAERVVASLPSAVERTPALLQQLIRDTQVRLWWEHTPLDLFLNSTPYHQEVAGRIRFESFAGERLPFLSCQDLAVFKAFFNRTKTGPILKPCMLRVRWTFALWPVC